MEFSFCQNQFTHHRRGRVRTKHQFRIRDASPDRQPKIQSSSVEGDPSKNYGADQQRLQISDLHFDKFSTPATFACWKIRFKTSSTCSQFHTEAMLWIKEVEMVDSVDDLKSSCSVRGIRMPDFEVLDAKIASALNRIIHNSQNKRTVSLEEHKAQKEDRFLRGRQIAYLIYEYFRVSQRWPGGWGPQGRSSTGGGGLARVPNLRVCYHLRSRVGTYRGKRMN